MGQCGGALVSDRVVLVTGGNRGIGHAIATRLAAAGHQVAITSRSGEADDADGLLVVKADVTDPDSVDAAVSEVEEKLGNVEVLVSNAGITKDGPILRMSDDEFTAVVDANLTGSFRVAKRVSKGMMRGRWGRMIFISSISGLGGQPGQVNYAAAKSGIHGFTKALAQEGAAKGITVNAIAPGYVLTDMVRAVPEKVLEKIIATIPVGRLGDPNDIARGVLFLVSDEAGFITGSTVDINGGQHMY